MAGLNFVGPQASDPEDLVTRGGVIDELDSAPVNRTDVASQVQDEATTVRASKVYVDTQDALYATPSYYQSQDALNVPVASVGVADGVAGLDSGSQIPLPQLPVLGAGYLLGPYGPQHQDHSTAVFSGSTGSTPLKICDWELGTLPVSTFRPLVFMNALVSGIADCWPIIEVRISDGAASYATQTLVARGVGRTCFVDAQSISVIPCPSSTGASGTSTPPSYTNPYLTAWMFCGNGQAVTLGANGIISAACYLLRTAE